MATYKHIRSNVGSKRPTTSLADGQIAINTNVASPGVFFKDSAGTGIVKVGPVHVGTSAPNSTPGAGGSTGNSKGEQWLDTSLTPAQLKVWNGSAWVGVVADELPVSKLQNGSAYQLLQTDAAGTGVEWASNIDVPGSLNVTSTAVFDSTASHPLGSAAAPTITFTGDANTGIYSPGANQVAISTNGTGRLFVDANGDVGIGTSSPGLPLEVFSSNGLIGLLPSATNGNTIRFGGVGNTANQLIFKGSGDVERARIDSNGRLLVGTSTAFPVRIATTAITPQQQLAGPNGTASTFVQGCASTTDSTAAFHWFAKFASGTINNNTTVVNANETLGTITWSGSDGTNQTQAAHIHCQVDGTPGADDMPGRLVFSTTADGAASPTERLHINSVGQTMVNSAGTAAAPVISKVDDTDTGIFFPAADTIAFANGGAEAARIDSSGRLLIGTSTALTAFFGTTANRLAIGGGAAPQVLGCYSTNQFGPRFDFIKSRSATVNGQAIVSIDDRLGELNFGGSDGTAPIPAARIICQVDGTPGTNDMPGRLVFFTTADGASTPTERMRISSEGRTDAFGTSETLRVRTAATTAAASIAIRLQAGATSITAGGTTEFQVTSNGNVANTTNSYGAISDIKLKENIVDANSQWNDLKALQVRNYNFKEGQTHTQIGLVAQEAELVSPGLVNESPDHDAEGNDLGTVTKSVNYSVLYMKAVKALQEAMERIETFEQRLSDAGIA
jgi:hypothetical protein